MNNDNIRIKILEQTVSQCRKLLRDYRLMPDPDATQQQNEQLVQFSQFTALYPTAYDAGGNRTQFYPLSDDEAIDLEHSRLLTLFRVGYINIENLEKSGHLPALFITDATDTYVLDSDNARSDQITEVYPINFRLVMKQPDDDKLTDETSNPYTTALMKEGLDYVLDPSEFINMTAERRGYRTPSIVNDAILLAGQNLESLATPYEVIDYRMEFHIAKQYMR